MWFTVHVREFVKVDGRRDVMFVAPWNTTGVHSDTKPFEWQVYSVAINQIHVSVTDGRLDRGASRRASA